MKLLTSTRLRSLTLWAVLLLLLAATAACRNAPLLNVQNASYPMGPLPGKLGKVETAVVQAGAELGWIMTRKSQGHLVGTLNLRSHQAVVDVFFTPKDYSIMYKDSANLHYDGQLIHKRYNTWVQTLNNRIRVKLAAL